MKILVGDVGGTNARLGVVEVRGSSFELLAAEALPSRQYPEFQTALGEYLAREPHAQGAMRACFGIAGPIRDNCCHATNLPWVIDGDALARELGLEAIRLLNDVEAAAWGLPTLKADGLVTLHAGRRETTGNLALLSPGTGLGEALLFWDGQRHQPVATEGGNADLSPNDEEQMELWRWAHRLYGHVSWEHFVSGPGLEALFSFCLERSRKERPSWFVEAASEGDAAAQIAARAADGSSEEAEQALGLFFALLGSEAGNLALRSLATGGLFLAGGILPKLRPLLQASRFRETFVAKGRFRWFLEAVPVHLVLDRRLGLFGAAAYEVSRLTAEEPASVVVPGAERVS